MKYHTNQLNPAFRMIVFVFLAGIVSACGGSSGSTPNTITAGDYISRVSVASDGSEGNDRSSGGSLSADGRYVAFESYASNLVANDTNGVSDIFVHDTQTGVTIRVSVSSEGAEGNQNSYYPVISADGRYVAFESYATNLVVNDTNGASDIFVHDTQTGKTSRVSVSSDGSEGNWYSHLPSISADGRYVAFQSDASNLVADDTNEGTDMFVYDTKTGTITRVSVASDGSQGSSSGSGGSLSANGRYAVFSSYASNLVSNDTNDYEDVFVHDTQTGNTIRVSVSSGGTEGNGNSYLMGNATFISDDGRYVGFQSVANNLVNLDFNSTNDSFVHDIRTGMTTLVSVSSDGDGGNADSYGGTVSSDGRYVAFQSNASNLVANDTNLSPDIFVHDTQLHTTIRVSVNGREQEGIGDLGSGGNDGESIYFSADGHYLGFESGAMNLVNDDGNGTLDVFRILNVMQ